MCAIADYNALAIQYMREYIFAGLFGNGSCVPPVDGGGGGNEPFYHARLLSRCLCVRWLDLLTQGYNSAQTWGPWQTTLGAF